MKGSAAAESDTVAAASRSAERMGGSGFGSYDLEFLRRRRMGGGGGGAEDKTGKELWRRGRRMASSAHPQLPLTKLKHNRSLPPKTPLPPPLSLPSHAAAQFLPARLLPPPKHHTRLILVSCRAPSPPPPKNEPLPLSSLAAAPPVLGFRNGFHRRLSQSPLSERNGSNARGYFVWSFLDVFKLLDGFVSSFGLYCVDLNDPDLRRYPKLSQRWYSSFLKGESISLSDVHAGNDPGALPQ
ncbi:hypothetical protein Droror1_Dr00021766 [Drosera rotundifolia]